MKFWKNFVICMVAIVSCILFSACNCSRTKVEVSKDLDGDGIISEWETIFEKTDVPNRIITSGNIVEISSFDELKSINEKTGETNTYVLTKNIDCGGESVCIDLGKSSLYGNNKVIKNFKFSDYKYYVGSGEDKQEVETSVKGLFVNGVKVFDLRLFVGFQEIEVKTQNTYTTISPLVNVQNIENMTIKGKLKINRVESDARSLNGLDVSLCVATLNHVKDALSNGSNMFDILAVNTSVNKVETIGKIEYSQADTLTTLKVGSIMPNVNLGSIVCDTKSSVDIIALGQSEFVGGIVGANSDLVSTSTYTGNITTSFDASLQAEIGGIAGRNNSSGEIKNCITSGKINFSSDTQTQSRIGLFVGGVVGVNYGILDYIDSNTIINLKDAPNLIIGGVCGQSLNGIFSNIINRSQITLENCSNLEISELCGKSQYGHFEHIVDSPKIKVDNSNNSSSIRLGLLTMFEDTSISEGYNAIYSPTFAGILLNGNIEINQKSGATFNYNLGLRNTYEYDDVNDDGEITGKKTRLPDQFYKLFRLESYSLKKNIINNGNTLPESLTLTYAKDSSNQPIISRKATRSLNVKTFVDNLGFRYGLNHNEIDLSEIDLAKIKFTLSQNVWKSKFFEQKNYNGELAYYDKYINGPCTFDEKTDEMYSLLNDLILSNTTSLYTPLKFSYAFLSSINSASVIEPDSIQEGDTTTSTVMTPYDLMLNFGQNICLLASKVAGIKDNNSLELLDDNKKQVSDADKNNIDVKYIHFRIYDVNHDYDFMFNVSQSYQMAKSAQGNFGDSIVYFQYKRS